MVNSTNAGLVLTGNGRFEPGVIVARAGDITKDKSGEECDYEVTIHDDYIE